VQDSDKGDTDSYPTLVKMGNQQNSFVAVTQWVRDNSQAIHLEVGVAQQQFPKV
jgi:hypothetical protein